MIQKYIKIKDIEIPINIKNYKNSKSIKMYFKANVLNITKPTRLSDKRMMGILKLEEDELYNKYKKIMSSEVKSVKQWENEEKIFYKGKHMKIIKKVKWALVSVWIFIVLIMVIGTIVIGRSYLSEMFGDGYSIQSLYSISDPIKETYRNLSIIMSEVQEDLQTNPNKFYDKKYFESLNQKAGNYRTSVLVYLNGEFVYSGIQKDIEELESSLLTKRTIYTNGERDIDQDNNLSEVSVEDMGAQGSYSFGENGKTYEYMLTTPQAYLCNEIDYQIDGKPISVFLVTYYGNYVSQFKSALVGFIFMMFLIMLVLTTALSALVYTQFIRPLVRLKEAAEEIGTGNLNSPVDVSSSRKDEIGELCRSFNDMRVRLNESVELKMQYEEENRELISNISHDLKTPITTIKGYVEGLMDGVADTPEKQDRYLKMIYNKANELDALINELSLYTNITNNAIPYEFHRVSVKDYFNDCMEEVRADLLSHNMTLTYNNYCAEDVKVVVDPDQLKRVINNVVTNAIKYTDKEEGHIDISIEESEKMVKVSINDDGRGIDKESLPHIFDRTYRADSARRSRGGSGLGLAICKKIVEEHGGKIWATSTKGEGTTIYFTLKKYIKEENKDEQNIDN